MDSIRCIFLTNRLNHARLGMAVSRKYGNAVQRNRFKRQIRDAFRQHAIRGLGIDLLIVPIAKAECIKTPTATAQALFAELVRRFDQA